MPFQNGDSKWLLAKTKKELMKVVATPKFMVHENSTFNAIDLFDISDLIILERSFFPQPAQSTVANA